MPLVGLVTGELSWRRLGVLVRGLPSDSATFVAVNGDQFEWGAAEHLLAHLVDLLAGANWQRGGGKGPRPKPIPRPGKNPNRAAQKIGGGRGLPLDELRRALNDDDPDGGDGGGSGGRDRLRLPGSVGEGPGEVDQRGVVGPAGG